MVSAPTSIPFPFKMPFLCVCIYPCGCRERVGEVSEWVDMWVGVPIPFTEHGVLPPSSMPLHSPTFITLVQWKQKEGRKGSLHSWSIKGWDGMGRGQIPSSHSLLAGEWEEGMQNCQSFFPSPSQWWKEKGAAMFLFQCSLDKLEEDWSTRGSGRPWVGGTSILCCAPKRFQFSSWKGRPWEQRMWKKERPSLTRWGEPRKEGNVQGEVVVSQ